MLQRVAARRSRTNAVVDAGGPQPVDAVERGSAAPRPGNPLWTTPRATAKIHEGSVTTAERLPWVEVYVSHWRASAKRKPQLG
jgi:hypothetical protein